MPLYMLTLDLAFARGINACVLMYVVAYNTERGSDYMYKKNNLNDAAVATRKEYTCGNCKHYMKDKVS